MPARAIGNLMFLKDDHLINGIGITNRLTKSLLLQRIPIVVVNDTKKKSDLNKPDFYTLIISLTIIINGDRDLPSLSLALSFASLEHWLLAMFS